MNPGAKPSRVVTLEPGDANYAALKAACLEALDRARALGLVVGDKRPGDALGSVLQVACQCDPERHDMPSVMNAIASVTAWAIKSQPVEHRVPLLQHLVHVVLEAPSLPGGEDLLDVPAEGHA